MFEQIIEKVRSQVPLVHCITNYVTVNDVANMVLACGASPIMADDEAEAADITSICNSLMINIGTLNARTIASMLLAGARANALGHPVVLDPVGAGASALRTQTTLRLLEKIHFSVIRGNFSEIKTVAQGSGTTKGVDADASDAICEENLDEVVAFIKRLAQSTGAVIAVTGAIDVVADAQRACIIRNGNARMSKITGTGCMLSGVVAGWCGAHPDRMLEAAAAAVCAMGVCGEMGVAKMQAQQAGTSSLRTYIIDAMSNLDTPQLMGGARVEVR
nr:hydroxyethylthiazole kinase [Maliibacterium massiliense]